MRKCECLQLQFEVKMIKSKLKRKQQQNESDSVGQEKESTFKGAEYGNLFSKIRVNLKHETYTYMILLLFQMLFKMLSIIRHFLNIIINLIIVKIVLFTIICLALSKKLSLSSLEVNYILSFHQLNSTSIFIDVSLLCNLNNKKLK